MAVLDGAKSVLGKYFNSLSVPSLLGHDRVTLFPADDDGEKISGGNLANTKTPQTDDDVTNLLNAFKDKVNAIGNNIKSDSDKYGNGEVRAVEVDACKSFIYRNSVSSAQYSTESRQMFLDSNVENPSQISINGYFENTKMELLQRLSKPDVWMYVVNYKNFEGVANRIDFKKDSSIHKLYYITSLTITDIDYSNMFQAQIELKEVRLFKKISVYSIDDSAIYQTNSTNGDNTATSGKKVNRPDTWASKYIPNARKTLSISR